MLVGRRARTNDSRRQGSACQSPRRVTGSGIGWVASKGKSLDDEEVSGPDRLSMVGKEGAPALAGRSRMATL